MIDDDLDDPEPWLGEDGTDEERESDAPVARDPDLRCPVIGLPGAGKTSLLFALNQACLDAGRDEFDLEFVPDDEPTLALMQSAADFLFRGIKVNSTTEVTTYNFRVFVQDRRRPKEEYPYVMSVTDGQGGHLVASGLRAGGRLHGWDTLVEQARAAQCLLLCADASVRSLEQLYHGLPDMLRAFRGSHRKLPHRRVLLLLTKIDVVIHRFLASCRTRARARRMQGLPPASTLDLFAGGVSRGDASPGMSVETLARSISPLGQAHAHLGKIVSLLQGSVEPTAVLATGVCSAYGLAGAADPDDARSAEARLAAWTPYGVREALLFLAAGDIRHPIERVPRRGFEPGGASWPIPLWPE